MKRIFLIAVFVFSLINLSFAQTDSDSDGVPDGADLCEDTVFPESVPWTYLGPDSFALTNNDTIFDTTVHCGQSEVEASYSLNDTCGCSCEQVLSVYYRNMYSQGSYHSYYEMYIYKYLQLNFGCTRSVLDAFIEENCPADNEPVSCNGIPEDEPSVCSGNGVCESQNVCVCEAGWEGEWCEEETPVTCDDVLETDPNVCLGRGDCVAQDQCACEDGYLGDNCEDEKMCNGVSYFSDQACSGHGDCQLDGTCDCYDDYDGDDCDNDTGITCYGKHPDEACGNGECVAQDTCECDAGWTGDDCEEAVPTYCFGVLSTAAGVCSGFGVCVAEDDCQCDEFHQGAQCQDATFTCWDSSPVDEDVCTGMGTCIAQDTCECEDGYAGEACEFMIDMNYYCEDPVLDNLMSDDPRVCNGKGVCRAPVCDTDCCIPTVDQPCQGECAPCFTGWEGDNCEVLFTCYGILRSDPDVCSGRGQCIGTDNCGCDPDYQGDNCEEEATGGDEKTGTVMYDFEATDEEELSVSEGDTVTILKDVGEWLYVRSASGEEGYVPTTYIQQIE